jgi:hypothetical protein
VGASGNEAGEVGGGGLAQDSRLRLVEDELDACGGEAVNEDRRGL